jgi:hypothetical protein
MMFPMTQTTFVHVLQLVKVDCKHKIPNLNPFSIFLLFVILFVLNCMTFRLVHFRLEYLSTDVKNWVVG